MAKNPRLIDITGQVFGLWTVLRQDGNRPEGGALFLARCQCGTEKRVLGADLRRGQSTNCGCEARKRLGDATRTHGEAGTRLHRIWKSMRARCLRPTYPGYARYGGRGITICEGWSKYEVFRDWAVANGYRDDLSIDRVDNNKGYYPQNCRWATHKTQSRNRNFVALTSDGRPGPEVAEENGIPVTTYNQRRFDGWSVDDAATLPYGVRRTPRLRDERGQFTGNKP